MAGCNERSSQVRRASVNELRAVILRTNLRGFVKTAERLESQAIVPMLDEYLDFVSNIARKYGGEVYGTDPESVTVGFGPCAAQADGTVGIAIRAAKELLGCFEQLSNLWRARADAVVALSLGIHQGEVVAAHLGSGSNRRATLVGDTMYVAARLAERARAGEAILSASIHQALREPLPGVEIKPLGGLSFSSRSRHINIYCLPRASRLDLGEIRRESAQH